MRQIVLGPPGTGKTRKLLDYVAEELRRGVSPEQIGYVSFTRQAAREAISRATEQFNLPSQDFPFFSTLHSLCYRQLGLGRGSVFEGAAIKKFSEYAGVKITGRWSEDGTMTGFDIGDRILFMDNLARVRCIPLRQAYDMDPDMMSWNVVKHVTDSLLAFKRANGLHDFTDMLREFLQSNARVRLKSLFVDEAQDLSLLQWHVVDRLAQDCERVVIAGDDDQAIYVWSGADVDHLIDMQGDVSVLGQSWRVPPVIQHEARGVIRNVSRRRSKPWRARAGEDGRVERVMKFDDADCGQGETLVLARNTYVLREQVEPELRRQGIIYERYGQSSLDAKILSAITAWERLRGPAGEPVEASQVRQVYEYMTPDVGVKRGFKSKVAELDPERLVSLAELQQHFGLLRHDPWFKALDRLPPDEVEYIRAARARGERLTQRPRVRVSTIHGSKGGEADHVVVMKEMASRTFREMRDDPENEARVWYVAATRARQRLTIVESQTGRSCPWL